MPLVTAIPHDKGIYALVLHAEKAFSISVGKLGILSSAPGYFVYLGSAFGKGGLAARIAHHALVRDRRHWHIDYLRRVVALKEVWFCTDRRHLEHDWAKLVGGMPAVGIPQLGFGSSDCRCSTHLYYFTKPPSPARLARHCRLVYSSIMRVYPWTD